MGAVNIVALGASLVFGVLTIIFIWNGLRSLYQGGRRDARDILYISLLSLLTSALVIWQVLDVFTQNVSH